VGLVQLAPSLVLVTIHAYESGNLAASDDSIGATEANLFGA